MLSSAVQPGELVGDKFRSRVWQEDSASHRGFNPAMLSTMQLLAIALAVLSGLVALGNVAGIVRATRDGMRGVQRGYSCVPLVAFIFGAMIEI